MIRTPVISIARFRAQRIGGLRFAFGLLVSAVCLYLSLQGIRFDQLWAAISGAQWGWLSAGVLLFLVSYLARAFRWQVLLYPRAVHFQNVLSILCIGYLLSNILPARLGDVARAYLIGEREKVSKASALSTIAVERITDGLCMGLMLLGILTLLPQVSMEARATGLLAAIGGVIALLALALLSARLETIKNILERPLARIRFLPRAKLWKLLAALMDGFAILRAPRPLAWMLCWSLVAWAFNVAFYWLLMIGLGMNLPPTAAALVIAITGLAVVVPSSPGYIGVFHYAAQQALVLGFGADPSISLSFAFLAHGLTYLTVTLVGVFFLWREGLSLGDLQSQHSNVA